jgi:DNA-binding GntR family transcriptional regulator
MKTSQHKYTKIANDILGRINRGDLAPGARLPGLRALGEQFGCNYHTARHALAELAKHGHVKLRPGSGCFVAAKPGRPARQVPASRRLGVLLPLKQWSHYVIRLIDQLHHSAEKKGTG